MPLDAGLQGFFTAALPPVQMRENFNLAEACQACGIQSVGAGTFQCFMRRKLFSARCFRLLLSNSRRKKAGSAPRLAIVVRLPLFVFAHLGLQVVGQAHFFYQVNLGFQEVDVFFRVVQDSLQDVA